MHGTIFRLFVTILSCAHLIHPLVLDADAGICDASNPVDLSNWLLELPAGKPNVVKNSRLCDGFEDKDNNFQVGSDGTLTMKVPPRSQCIPLKKGGHCRTELKEVTTFSPAASQNRLKVSLEVLKGTNICIGQAFREKSEAGSKGPFLELYWNREHLKVTLDANSGERRESSRSTKLGDMQRGKVFSYEFAYENDELSVAINGERTNLGVPQDLHRANKQVFFKAGNYNQGGDEAVVRISELKTTHST